MNKILNGTLTFIKKGKMEDFQNIKAFSFRRNVTNIGFDKYKGGRI